MCLALWGAARQRRPAGIPQADEELTEPSESQWEPGSGVGTVGDGAGVGWLGNGTGTPGALVGVPGEVNEPPCPGCATGGPDIPAPVQR